MPGKKCFWLLWSVYEWTHQEYIIVVPNAFILFQFTSLDPNGEHEHARGSKLCSTVPLSMEFLEGNSILWTCEKKLLWGFLQYHFILGWKENGPLLYIKLYSLVRSYTVGMKELDSILLMTYFWRFNLDMWVMHTIKILESGIWFIIFPIFHCSQNWGSEGEKVV